MKKAYRTAQRRKILAALIEARGPLCAATVADRRGLAVHSVTWSLRRLEDHGWLAGTPSRPCPRTRRYYVIVPSALPYIRDAYLDDD